MSSPPATPLATPTPHSTNAAPTGDRQSFSDFDKLLDTTNAILDVRDELATISTDLGLDLPTGLETAYETATSAADLDDAKALADDYLAAVQRLDDANHKKNGSHGVFGSIGLITSDADREYSAALHAYTDGNLSGTTTHADRVISIVDDAPGQGLLYTGLLLLLILLIAALIWFRHRRAHAIAPAADEPIEES